MFASIRKHLPEELQVATTVAFTLGWRKREVLDLKRHQYSAQDQTLRLEPGSTKNGEGRSIGLTPELHAMLDAQVERVGALERKVERVIPWLFPHLRRARMTRASLNIPELETYNVKRHGPPGSPATRQSDVFHQLILRNERVAGVAAFPVAWITPRASDALTRQTTVLELLPDEEQEGARIHKRVSRVADQQNNARFTGVPTPRNVNP